MMDWRVVELKNITTKIGSGATPTGGKEAYKEEGVSLIRSQNILDFEFSYSGLAFIDETQASRLKNVIIEKKDVLINITGDSVARVAMVPVEVLPARINQHVAILRADKEQLDSEYLLYYLLNSSFKRHLLQLASSGATRSALTKSDLEGLMIKIPSSLQEQKEIAKTLSNLDQKITLLRQQNETLEQMAQTLFKRWFVDFEFPNEQGQPYRSAGGEMVASELGEIPLGWEVGSLDEIANYLNGLACQKYPVEDNSKKLPVLKIKELGNGISQNSDWVTSEVAKKYIIEDGDIIFSWSGTLIVKIWNGERCVLNQHLFKVTSEDYPKWFIYQWTSYHLKSFIAIAESKATTMGHIKRSHLTEAMCFIPSLDLMNKGTQLIRPLLDTFVNNNKQIQTLTKLRDTLLPKLMSGEIRIPTS